MDKDDGSFAPEHFLEALTLCSETTEDEIVDKLQVCKLTNQRDELNATIEEIADQQQMLMITKICEESSDCKDICYLEEDGKMCPRPQCVECQGPIEAGEGAANCEFCRGRCHLRCGWTCVCVEFFCETCFFRHPCPGAEDSAQQRLLQEHLHAD